MFDAFIAAPLLLALVCAAASIAKWNHTGDLRAAATLLRLPKAAISAARFVPIVEAVLAVGLVIVPWPAVFTVVSALTLGLMLLYTAVIGWGLTLTPRPSCGCFGRIGHPVTSDSLVRNVVLSLLGVASVVWGFGGNSVPLGVWRGGWPVVAWLVALVATGAVVRWIVSERVPVAPPSHEHASPYPVGGHGSVGSEERPEEFEEYVRVEIPAVMLLQDDRPVTLRRLAESRAQLLIWVTCGCTRSFEAVERAAAWRESLGAVLDVRLVSTMPPETTEQQFVTAVEWLYDPDEAAMRTIGMRRDPAALLLGADGLVAGGPVEGLDELDDLVRQIEEQLAAS